MKKSIGLALVIITIIASIMLAPINTSADDKQQTTAPEVATANEPTTQAPIVEDTPVLLDISFKNAKLDTEFEPSVYEYTITLDDNTVTPTLEKYLINGDANIFVTYDSDDTNHKTGITATIEYETGSKKYTFKYSNPPQYVVTSNCNLSDVYVFCGEVYPQINDEDTSYKLFIPSDMTNLKISPSTQDINAYCVNNFHETTLLPDQTFTITLTCVAPDGTSKDYTFDIKRSSKTEEEVKVEMRTYGYASLVEGTRFYEKPEFKVACGCVIGGTVIIIALYIFTKRIALNPYDKDEKPFYSTVE